MADSFSPDIGMDIGASNVTPKSAPTADFGRIGSFLGSAFSKPKVTQESIDNKVLLQFGEDVAPFANLPPAEKAVRTIAVMRQYSQAYSGLSAKFETATKNITGVEDVNAGTPFSIEQTIVTEFAKTDEFMANQDSYFAAATDPTTGEVNQIKLNRLMIDGSRRVAAEKNALQDIQDEAVRDKNSIEKGLFGDFNSEDPKKSTKGYFATQLENNQRFVDLRTTSGVLSKVSQNPMLLSPQVVGAELGTITSTIAQTEQKIRGEIASIPGIDMSDSRIEPFIQSTLAPLKGYKSILEQGPEALKAYAATLESSAKIIESNNVATRQEAYSIIGKQLVANGYPEAFAYLPETQKAVAVSLSKSEAFISATSIESYKTDKSAVNVVAESPSFAGMNYSQILNQGLTLNTDGTPVAEDPTAGYTKLEIDTNAALPAEGKIKDKEATYTLIAGWNPEISTPESFNVLAPVITNTMLSARNETKPVPDADMKKLMPENFARMGSAALANNEELGKSFLSRTDQFMSDQISKHGTDLQRNLGAFMMQTDAKYIGSVFSFTMENGQVSIKLNPQAKNEQAWLRDAIARAGSEDPMKILGVLNSTPLFAALANKPVVNVKEVEATLKSVNYLLSIKNQFSPQAKALMPSVDQKVADEFVKATQYQPLAKEVIAGTPVVLGQKVPEEYKAILPTLLQYYALKDKFITADTPEERTQIAQSLKTLKDAMPGIQTKGEARDPSASTSVNPWDLALPPKVSGIIDSLYKAQITAKLSGVAVPPLPEAPAPVAPPVPSETPAVPAVTPRRFRLGEDGNLTEVTQ